MSLLTIVQDACDEIGLSRPSTVIGSADPDARQLLALSNRGGQALAARFAWQECIREFTHTTLAAELQGDVDAIMPGFNWLVYETMWNRTQDNPAGGPLYPDEWQLLKSASVTGPYPQFRIRQKKLYLLPAPPAGETLAGEYVSRFWCQSEDGTGQTRWVDNTDTGILPEDLLTLDLVWRWNRAKRLDYAEEKMEFEYRVSEAMARNGGNRTLSLAEPEQHDPRHNLFTPPGSWQL